MFIVEGIKSVLEFIQSSYAVSEIYSTDSVVAKLGKIPQNIKFNTVSDKDFGRISTLRTPQGVLALAHIPTSEPIALQALKGKYSLALDGVQDPGNLGTIIRTAEWFGIKRLLCSHDTADAYNPKVVQASMGSLARTEIHYLDLHTFLNEVTVPVYGAVLDGTSLYETAFEAEGIILLGNEGNGIRKENLKRIQHPVTIPRVGQAESLNVAISAALFCSEVSRTQVK